MSVLLLLALFVVQYMDIPAYSTAYTPASNPNFRKSIARFSSPSGAGTKTTKVGSTPYEWKFRGHEVYAQVSKPDPSLFETTNLAEKTGKFLFGGDGDYLGNKRWRSQCPRPAIVLVHGFGCSTTYWRETIQALTSAGYTVHALDLIGQGQSAKPGRSQGIEYSISLWAEQVEAYCNQFIPPQEGIVVMGNSLGSLVALSAATGDFATDKTQAALPCRIQGIGMYNCGIGLNTRNLLKDPELNRFQKAIFTAVFDVLDQLIFANEGLLAYVLENVVTPELLRNALVSLYQCSPDPSRRVDDTLVQSFYKPSQDPGSAQALSQIYTNDAGKTPMELHEDHRDLLQKVPIHLVWGTRDGVTPLDGVVGKYYVQLMKEQEFPVSVSIVESGHIPFDEIPESNEFMVQWLEDVVTMEKNGPPNASPAGGSKKRSLFGWP